MNGIYYHVRPAIPGRGLFGAFNEIDSSLSSLECEAQFFPLTMIIQGTAASRSIRQRVEAHHRLSQWAAIVFLSVSKYRESG